MRGLCPLGVAGAAGLLLAVAGGAAGQACDGSAPADALIPGGDAGDFAPAFWEAVRAQANASVEFRGSFYGALTQEGKELTIFAPTDAALAEAGGAAASASALSFSGVPWSPLEEWEEGYTYAPEGAGKLRVSELSGNATVTGPCNAAGVLNTVEFCGSTVHIVDALLLPASACMEPECGSQGEEGEEEACCDTRPGDFPCRQEKEWGKCEEDWMERDGFCRRTCGFCEPPVAAAMLRGNATAPAPAGQ